MVSRAASSEDDYTTADELNDTSRTGYVSSDDEAPEEETVATGRSAVEQKEKELDELERQEKAKIKNQRRIRDQRFREQKAKKILQKSDVPEVLPDDILEALEEPTEEGDSKKGKHMKFDDDEDDEMDDEELQRQLKEAKRQLLQEMKKTDKKVGNINVKLLKAKQKVKMAPPAVTSKNSTVGMREKWLKRKSLGKRARY